MSQAVDLSSCLEPEEMHLTLRVRDLEESTRFYSWLLGTAPKTRSSNHTVIVNESSRTNFVLIAVGATQQGGANIHHLGIGCASKAKLLEAYRSALDHEFEVEAAPETTWSGTPLHQLWLRDPDGTRVEVYARLTEDELARGRPGSGG